MAGLLQSSSLLGQQFQTQHTSRFCTRPQRQCFTPVVAGKWKKVNKVDESWKKVRNTHKFVKLPHTLSDQTKDMLGSNLSAVVDGMTR